MPSIQRQWPIKAILGVFPNSPHNIETNPFRSLRSQIRNIRITSCWRSNGSGYQHRIGIFPINISIEFQTIIQHSQIQSQVIIHRLLPFQVGIPESRNIGSHSESILQVRIIHISCISFISREILISRITDWKTQFKPIHPISHKSLIMNIPSNSHWPAICKSFVRSEYGRSIFTEIYIQQISIIISIIKIHIKTRTTCRGFTVWWFTFRGILVGKSGIRDIIIRKTDSRKRIINQACRREIPT